MKAMSRWLRRKSCSAVHQTPVVSVLNLGRRMPAVRSSRSDMVPFFKSTSTVGADTRTTLLRPPALSPAVIDVVLARSTTVIGAGGAGDDMARAVRLARRDRQAEFERALLVALAREHFSLDALLGVELLDEARRGFAEVHEVAETAAVAFACACPVGNMARLGRWASTHRYRSACSRLRGSR